MPKPSPSWLGLRWLVTNALMKANQWREKMKVEINLKAQAVKTLEAALVAAQANTPEEQARVAWRMSDYFWQAIMKGDALAIEIAFARVFNNLVQEKDYPWVKDLWSTKEQNSYAKELTQSAKVI